MLLWIVVGILIFADQLVADQCRNEFPLKETLDILNEIVKKYGKTVSVQDETRPANRYENVLIPEKTRVEVNGVEYRLNVPDSPISTFFFKSQEFVKIPIFVVPEDKVAHWSARHPDFTYELHKISFDCPGEKVVCGLKCCGKKVDQVQEAFLQDIDRKRRRLRKSLRDPAEYDSTYYRDNAIILHDNVEYTLKEKQGFECSYRLSQFDKLYKKRNTYNVVADTVYYKCPEDHSCCSMQCIPPPIKARVVGKVENRTWLEKTLLFVRHYNTAILMSLTIFLSLLFFWITYAHKERCREEQLRGVPRQLRNMCSIDTQTSSLSLHTLAGKEQDTVIRYYGFPQPNPNQEGRPLLASMSRASHFSVENNTPPTSPVIV